MAQLRPWEAGQCIAPREFRKNKRPNEYNGLPSGFECDPADKSPKKPNSNAHTQQRERRHPTVSREIHQERLNNPGECDSEIARTGNPADAQGLFSRRRLADQCKDETQSANRGRPHAKWFLAQGRDRANCCNDRPLAQSAPGQNAVQPR